MKEEEIKKLNIYEKLSKITTEMGVVEKGLKVQVNKTASYSCIYDINTAQITTSMGTEHRSTCSTFIASYKPH